MKTSELCGSKHNIFYEYLTKHGYEGIGLTAKEHETFLNMSLFDYEWYFMQDHKYFYIDALSDDEQEVMNVIKDDFVKDYGKQFGITELEWDEH